MTSLPRLTFPKSLAQNTKVRGEHTKITGSACGRSDAARRFTAAVDRQELLPELRRSIASSEASLRRALEGWDVRARRFHAG
jgi:hypothetical protein